MGVEPERPTLVHAQRLESSAPAEQRLVVRPDDGVVRPDQPAAGRCDGDEAQCDLAGIE